MEPTSLTSVPLVPPVRVTWYFVTPRSSVDGSQVSTTDTPSAFASTFDGAVGAWVSGVPAAQGSAAPAVTFLSFTVVRPAGTV